MTSLAVGVRGWTATTNTTVLAPHLSLLVDGSIAEDPGAGGAMQPASLLRLCETRELDMGLKRLKYFSLRDLLDHEPITEEDPDTAKIIRRLRHVKIDKELSRGEFLDICFWKSPRSIRQCERNSARTVGLVSRKVYASRSERKRLELLTSLYGVSVPTASAILTLTNPDSYGVIDIRVWQLLYALKSVRSNPQGQGFRFDHWYHYLKILRHHAKRLGISVRLVELSLFRFHQDHQKGRLYESRGKRVKQGFARSA